jgi:hypothetical protein
MAGRSTDMRGLGGWCCGGWVGSACRRQRGGVGVLGAGRAGGAWSGHRLGPADVFAKIIGSLLELELN